MSARASGRWLTPPRVLHGVALLLALVVSGCAALPESAGERALAQEAFMERAERVAAVPDWRLAGRLVLETPGESWSGQLSWRAGDDSQIIDLTGPMGRGGGRLVLGGERAMLLTRDGERYEASDPDALMVVMTGREIPVSGLDHWVRGMARPGVPFDLRADRSGQPMRLFQDGWEIIYRTFEDAGPARLPTSMELTRGEMNLRLTIQRWQLGVPAGS
ncbi:lipoprotein insertase outer membrane protein LolB [Thioalkalivibrio paradoxus]|uniref:lipoprotein insertase outer membrane protein LolB n=1 Tax=Thioalkalivibrio paradoxus TaxID=108010 RepID=UPI00022C5BF3|nr:lipoprotein insertase outer membrane protein LolB [Thioalkalivibrio paradoxus]